MSKNGNFFHGILTYFWIFHRLRPYLCSKRGELGFHKQATHRRRGDDNFGPFWAPLDHFGALTSLPCLAIFGPKWTIFGPSPVMNGRPQSKKKAHHHVSYVWPACGTPISTFWYINMVAIYGNAKNRSKLHEKMAVFCHFLAMNGKLWAQKKFSTHI